ncbi:antirestriction protein [Vibrio sp. S17_S38]|uniref:antirestriction protein n=1 Tax=Vibrio sp. S17_S38 TaxID=2720229 RepID=UPI001680FC67|nr:antirestriction protein [Vibrio sp. S17_S38]MBD1574832.1 antirestriction protein [Vibrio sp. S17_S38]
MHTSILPVEKRQEFYPSISQNFVHFEQCVYQTFDKHVEGYNGGYFDFMVCENGAAFSQLNTDRKLLLTNDLNYFQKEVTAQVASIAIFALVLARFTEISYLKGLKHHQEHFTLLSEKLREYYLTLDDDSIDAIYGFLD